MTQSHGKVTPPVREKESDSEGARSASGGYKARVIAVLAATMSVYAFLYVLRVFDRMGYFIPEVSHRSLILAFILTLGFLLLPMRKGEKGKLAWYDVLIIVIGVAGPLYNFFTWAGNSERYIFGRFYTFELVLTFATILAVLEATRRALGLAMPLVAAVFLLHMFFGSYIPGPLHTPAVRMAQVAHLMTYADAGVYGVALGVAATVVIAFIIFSQFMFATGAGDFFIKMALSLVGHVRGGPAKVAILASALVGTITGATTANIATTGVFTIPMMKRIGYKPEFAGAVETVSSNGGQIMPPVMGLVAFVMAQWLGMRYWDIALISFIPAILYFLAVFIMVDAEAGRCGLHGMPRSECPPILQTIKEGWLFLLPIVGLALLLGVLMYSPEVSILYALLALLLLSALKWGFGAVSRPETSLRGAVNSAGKVAVDGLSGGGQAMVIPGIACACAGIIIGSLAVTQIGITLSDLMVRVAGGNQFLLLVMAALACFILGMGMGSLPVYIMVVIVVAPALLKFGVPPLLTHMFVFWFAITSFLTPPVAVGAYVAAGIAGADPFRTAVTATRLGFCTFTLPFMFVYNPAILLQGSVGEIVLAIVLSLIGIALLSWGLAGYFLRKESRRQQLLFLAAGLLFVTLDLKLVVVGLALGIITVAWQAVTVRRERAQLRLPSA